MSGHEVYHDGPISKWKAWVVQVNPDGSADLDIAHPHGWYKPEDGKRDGFITMTCPDRNHHPDAPGVPHDPTGKRMHSFHREQR